MSCRGVDSTAAANVEKVQSSEILSFQESKQMVLRNTDPFMVQFAPYKPLPIAAKFKPGIALFCGFEG
jgi:hypothetical protein